MCSSRIIKSIAIICFSLLAAAIIVAINSPARDYEMSIYLTTPVVVWVAILLSILAGLGIVLHQLCRQQESRSRLWVIGLLLIASGFIILLSIHIFRGYPFYGRGDSITHLATVRDLLRDGHVTRQNFYPLTHIYFAELAQIWEVPPTKLFSGLPVFFNIMFMIFIFLLARTVLSRKGQVILATVAGAYLVSALGHGWMFADPNQLADSLMPLVFMLCLKRLAGDEPLEGEVTILFLIMMFVLPPFHPVATFALLVTLSSLWMPMKLYNALGKNRTRPVAEYRFIVPAVILFVWGISWISSFYVWEMTVRNVYAGFIWGGPTRAQQLEDQMLLASQYGYSVLEQFFKTYICLLFYGVLTLASFPLVVFRVSRDRSLQKLLALYGPLLLLTLVLVFFYSLNIGFNPERVTKYAAILSVPYVSYVTYELVQSSLGKKLWAKIGLSITVVSLVLIMANAVLIAYPSRYTLSPNSQATLAEPDGFDWLSTYRDSGLGLVVLTLLVDRLTASLPADRQQITRGLMRAPYHFNYPERDMLGEAYGADKYLALTTSDRVFYVDLFPEMAPYRFYQSDFDRLENDPSLDKIYLNQGMEVWYIRAAM